jgi:hypothetical protein
MPATRREQRLRIGCEGLNAKPALQAPGLADVAEFDRIDRPIGSSARHDG